MPIRSFRSLMSHSPASFKSAALALALAAGAASGQVVIAEVYGGGGNSGATYRNDFVELFNRGTSSVSIGNWSVQYASSSGTTWSAVSIPAGTTLAPGKSYLIQLASGGATGALLPSPNLTGAINMSATAGKVALCNNSTVLTGSCPGVAAIQDFVGYGSANCAEGGVTAGAPSNSTSAQRDSGGCEDTGNNGNNFTVAAPTPKNNAASAATCGGGSGGSSLRVCTWNVTGYVSNATRDAAFKTAIYSSFSGRSLAPDVIAAQEYGSSTEMNNFLNVLNTAPGSPGDWAAAPFINGNDLDNVFFYRTTRVTYVDQKVIAVGTTGATEQVRNTMRHDFRPAGLTGATNTIAVYNSHMKAGSTTSDQSRRLLEAQRIRDNAEGINTNGAGSGLPAGYNFVVVGDFNIQTSSQAAYQELVGSQVNNAGRAFDPINSAGSWNNNAAYKFIFTQEPKAAMDDRLDFILIGNSLKDGSGIDYIGNTSLAYSTTTWNDPNHSYRVWGNDGSTFDVGIAVAGNTMVGATIAQALKDSVGGSATGGHLPVFAEFTVPSSSFVGGDGNNNGGAGDDSGPERGRRLASIAQPAAIAVDLGRIALGREFRFPLVVGNSGDIERWGTRGIADLVYSLVANDAQVAQGPFIDAAGGEANTHDVTILPQAAGPGEAMVWVVSAEDGRERWQPVRFTFDAFIPGDLDDNGVLDGDDLSLMLTDALTADVEAAPVEADMNADGVIDADDAAVLVEAIR